MGDNAGELSETEQPFDWGPVNDAVPQETLLKDGEWLSSSPPHPDKTTLMPPARIIVRRPAGTLRRKHLAEGVAEGR
jgi:hypothetical protein